MGFFSEIKKLLFVKKAVAKSQGGKAMEYGMEKGKDLADASADALKNTGEIISEKTSGLRDAVLDKGADTFDSLKDTAGSTIDSIKDSELVSKAGETVSNLGETVIGAGGSIMDKAKEAGSDLFDKAKNTMDQIGDSEAMKKTADFTESVGDKVLDTGESFMEKVGNPVGEKLSDIKDDIVERASETTADLKEKLDETIVKAEAMAADEKLNPPKEFADDTLDASGSLLEGTDDFFSKAEKWADGDHGAFSEGKTSILDDRVPIDKKPYVRAAGFTDLDGDGDEIIDDALILEDLPDDDKD